MNTLPNLVLKYRNPSSRIEIPDELMEQHPDPALRLTLARAIGRIGYWFGEKEFYGDVFPRGVKDPDVRGGELRVAVGGMNRGALKILLYTSDEHASRFDPPHYQELPYASAKDAIISPNIGDVPRILPANGWRFRSSDSATTADIVVGHNFLAQAVGAPQIPIAPEMRTKALAHLCLTDDIPKEIMPFRSGL